MTRQYIACVFCEGDSRSYTYHNDGDPLTVGDKVKVEGRHGPSSAFVVAVLDSAPEYPTKSVISKVEAEA